MTPSLTASGLGVTASVVLMLAPWGSIEAVISMPVPSVWAISLDGSDHRQVASQGTVSGAPGAFEPRNTRAVSALVAELKTDSGLTADQLGRLLGVSRRSIHNWAAGSPIAPSHEERVRELSDLVFDLDVKSPEERRNLMLDSSAGPSIFRQFAETGTRNQQIRFDVPVTERFGL